MCVRASVVGIGGPPLVWRCFSGELLLCLCSASLGCELLVLVEWGGDGEPKEQPEVLLKGREAEYWESRAAQVFVWRLRSAGGERNKEEGDKRGSKGLALESLLELRTPEEGSGGRSSHTVTSAHTTSDEGRGWQHTGGGV